MNIIQSAIALLADHGIIPSAPELDRPAVEKAVAAFARRNRLPVRHGVRLDPDPGDRGPRFEPAYAAGGSGMSAAVDDDFYRYLRECEADDARTEEIEATAAMFRESTDKLGEAATWLDGTGSAKARARRLVGMAVRAALSYASGRASAIGTLVDLTHAGNELAADPELDAALFRLAEREVAAREADAAEFNADCREDR